MVLMDRPATVAGEEITVVDVKLVAISERAAAQFGHENHAFERDDAGVDRNRAEGQKRNMTRAAALGVIDDPEAGSPGRALNPFWQAAHLVVAVGLLWSKRVEVRISDQPPVGAFKSKRALQRGGAPDRK